jgi:inositol oxygenase
VRIFFKLFLVTAFYSIHSANTHNQWLLKRDMRDFDDPKYAGVLETYTLNHAHQTVDFVLGKKEQYYTKIHATMTMWQVALKMLEFIDESDPDIHQPQLYHAIQVAESMRANGLSDEWIVAGFIHDFGKMLFFFGEPQWAVVGDTFPVGCQFSDKIIFYKLFSHNPDTTDLRYNSKYGIYEPHCGLENVHISWGHDEYLYHVIRNSKLSNQVKYAIRFHSFYPYHEHSAYEHLLNDHDRDMLKWVKLLNHYDLYTKVDESMDIDHLLAYYKNLIEQFFPNPLKW